MTKNMASGLAAQLIDYGFAVKLPLCQEFDKALGIEESDAFSMTRFLRSCYGIRRPGFVMMDMCAFWPGFWQKTN